jgi:hypothetical protein
VGAVGGGLLAIALFVGGGVWLLNNPEDDEPVAVETQAPSPSAPESAPPPSPVAETSAAPPSAPQARCWDGSTAPALDQCSMPEGAAGLAWLFPQLQGQQCRSPRQIGSGVVVRVLCSATLPDGSTVRVGYYQVASVSAGDAYYDVQGLNRHDDVGFHVWSARLGKRTKKAVLYADAPYGRTLMFRTSASDSAQLQHLQPRSPDRVRGEPMS